MRRSNSGHSLQGEVRTNSLGESLAENNNGYNSNSLAEEVKETNGWDGGRASITFSPHRFTFIKMPKMNLDQVFLFFLCSRLEEWDAETVCRWFDSLGLYMYTNEVRHVQCTLYFVHQ